MVRSLDQEFGPIRSFLWPVHAHELRKLVPMLLMLFLICFNYTVLRNMKDAIVVTASGAEVIPFIKVWVMLPTAILLTYIFTRLCNRYSQERVFYIMISIFLVFFALFAFVLYPLHQALHPTHFAAYLTKTLPVGFKGFISMCCHWTFTIFYVMCELWSTSILTVLFWGFANEITKVGEARRFYGVLGVSASSSSVLAGQIANYLSFSEWSPSFPIGSSAWEQTLMLLIIVVLVIGLLTMGVFRWMSLNVLVDPSFEQFHQTKKKVKTRRRLSIKESFSYLANSKYLLCIATLVVAYNLVINMSEVAWKDQLAHLYSSPTEYNTYMNNLTSVIGLFAMVTALFMAKIIERIGWTRTALITPIMMAVTCAGFFSFLLFQDLWASTFTALAGFSPIVIAVGFGAAQNCLSKAAKYSVFDATKEMAFIPLDHDSKLKGKAAIDGVGSRVGKSGGSLLYQGLLMAIGTVSASAPYVAAILMLVIVVWMIAVRSLGKQFDALTVRPEERQEAPEASETASTGTVLAT
ncbi:MAG: NTP/NDP exchange transporter [Parachlamydiaceae bacterium]|nr:NTP/NDP exchange transporter [Parachlamydiaceae bacterium]